MTLRPYRVEDWSAVRDIYDLSKPDEMKGVLDPAAIPPLEADPDMKALFDDSRIVCMEDAGRVVGFAGSRDSLITWLFVHPSFRRKGVATALVTELLGRLTRPVTLNVAIDNLAARSLYERIGFALEREFTGHFQGVACRVAKLRYRGHAEP